MRGVLTAVAAALALLVTAAGASGNASHALRPLGLVPHVRGPVNAHAVAAAAPAPSFLTFDSPYESLINQYFADVAAASASHSTADVYSVATQYTDSSGPVQYQSTVGGSYVDHDPLPANGCSDGVDPACLTDLQLQAEIQNVLTAEGWHGSLANEFFLMTPVGVGSCGDASGSECSTDVFCAYHSDFTDSAGEPVIYANEPYEGALGGCSGPGQGFPDDEDADTTINTISHEHNESITDPFGSGWVAADGQTEDGDLCAYGYGSPLGLTSNGQPYNQLINSHEYSLQQEYSNAVAGCQQRTGGAHTPPTFGSGPLLYRNGPVMHTNTTYAIYWLPTAGNTSQPAVSGTPAVSHTLTSSAGSWNGAPTGFSFQWQRCSSGGTGCTNIAGATSSTYTLTTADGGMSVRCTVSATNVNGASPSAASAVAVVVPVPAASASPVVSGPAGVGKRLSTTNGSWNTSATFAYQWQRCATGGSCVPIAGATAATYALGAADAGHTLKAIVIATNVAGTASSTSAASHKVVAVPKSTKAPRISGKATVGHRLAAGRGKWTWTPTKFRYQWLRCSASGGRCVAIKKASRATYRVAKKDARHRLRLRVTATNAAGGRSANSRPTARVH
jgi:hypothetical protein